MSIDSEASFGEQLRRLRQAAGWSQEELAERAGLTAAAVGTLERGDRRRPYPQTLRALAEALALEPADRVAFFNSVHRRGENAADESPEEAREQELLEEGLEPAQPEDEAAPVPRRPVWFAVLPWTAAAALLGLVAGLALRQPGSEVADARPSMVWTLPPPAGTAYVTTSGPPALSPDGRRLVFVARGADGPRRLWLRALAAAEPKPLPGTEGATFPFWSPDSRFVAFFADDQLKRLEVATGTTTTVAPVAGAQGGTWSVDGTLLAARSSGRVMVRISPGGETVDVVPGQEPGDEWYFAPWFLPDGEHYLVTVLNAASPRPEGIYLANLSSGEARLLIPAVSNAQFAASGHVVYWRQGALRGQRFDLDSLELAGDPVLVEDNVRYASFDVSAHFAVGRHLLVHLPGGIVGPGELAWFDRGGNRLGTLGETADYFRPRLSADGSRLAVDVSDAFQPAGDIWIFDTARGAATRLTSDPLNESRPLWSPDGTEVVYFKGGSIYRQPASGAGEEVLVLDGTEPTRPTDWSADGRRLLFSKGPPGASDLWVLDLGSGEATPWLVSPFQEDNARFSPDGRWVAYTSDETGRFEVYVQDFPERREKHAVSLGEGWGPAWSRDGTELFFYAPGRGLMTVATRLAPELTAGKPRMLFAVALQTIDGEAYFDVTPDGQRFLVNRLVEQTTDAPLVFRTGWTRIFAGGGETGP